jgi:cobalt-zinc-cadmium efflux system outer membrane protein
MVGVLSGGKLRQLGTLFARGTIGSKTDAELLDVFASGDAAETAFEALVVRHGPKVLRACRRILPDPNDAEDAFQATFLVLARRASSGSIGRPESLGPWLHGVALRVARKARVAAARRRRHEQRVAARFESRPPPRNERAESLRDEVDRRPEPLRTPVVLCYLEDMTYQGAARRLDVSVGTIRGRLVKARGLLRSRLGRYGEVAVREQAEGLASQGRPPRVPPALAAATIRAAMALAPGGAGVLGISAAVAELMEGVLTMMLVTRWIVGALTVVAIGLAAGGAALAAWADDDRATAPTAAASELKPPRNAVAKQDPTPDPRPAAVLTLDTAIERLVRDTREEAIRLEIPQARADVLTAGFRAKPVFDADSPLNAYGRFSFRQGGFLLSDINISDPIDFSYRRQARIRSADRAKTVAEAQYQDAVRNRIDGLYSAYVDVQQAQERAISSAADLARWDRLLKETKKRAEQGIVTDDDVGQIESARQLARMKRSEDERALVRAKRALGSLLDDSVEESEHIEVERLLFRQHTIPPKEGLIRLALDSRPDLSALRLGVNSARAAFEEASKRANQSAGFYKLYQPYSFQDKTSPNRLGITSYALGVTVPLPVYSRNRGNIERTKLNLQQTQIQLAAQEKAISQDVGDRLGECDSARAEFRDDLINLQHRRRASQEAERRYETGEGGTEDVVKTWRDFESSDRQHLDQIARHRRSVLALNTAVGVRLFP